MIKKRALLNLVIERLEKDRQEAEQSRKAAYAAMVDAPGPMQSHSDTTRFQKANLIQKYDSLIAEKSQAISLIRLILESAAEKVLDRVQSGAVIEVMEPGGQSGLYVMVPYVAGMPLVQDGKTFVTITPVSPLGAALLNKRTSDEVVVDLDSTPKRLRILSIL